MAKRGIGEMGIALRCGPIHVSQQLADHRQAGAFVDCERREGMAQIMKPDMFKLSVREFSRFEFGDDAHALPNVLQCFEMIAFVFPRKYEGVARDSG